MPKSVALLEPIAARIAEGIAAELSEQDEFDFCEHFAAKLAARFFGEFLGMTAEEKIAVARHIHDLAPMFLRDKNAAELLAQTAHRETLLISSPSRSIASCPVASPLFSTQWPLSWLRLRCRAHRKAMALCPRVWEY